MRIALTLFCLFFNSFAEYIALRDGIASKTEILDTTGCAITIRQKGNVVKISKDKISFIVCKSDTLNYNEFICTPEIASQASNKKYENGYNAEKVNALINGFKADSTIVRNCLLYCCATPINGNEFQCCWDEKYNVFKERLKRNYPGIKQISKEDLFKLLRDKSDTNCVLIPYSVSIDSYSSVSYIKAIVNIKIIDLKAKSIILDDTSDFSSPLESFPAISLKDKKEMLVEAKAVSLEHALLNSIDPTRKVLTKLFLQNFGQNPMQNFRPNFGLPI